MRITVQQKVVFERLEVPETMTCALSHQATTVKVLSGHVDTDQQLTVYGIDGAATVTGSGMVKIPSDRTVRGLTLCKLDNEHKPKLHVGQRGAVVDVAVWVWIARAVDATINGRQGEPYRFVGIADARDQDPAKLQGATLRDFHVRESAAGRRYLRQLDHAAVVDPDLRTSRLTNYGFNWQTPVHDGALRRPWTWTRVTDENRRELHDAAFFAQELAGLVETKSGQGSTRTRAAWAAYRGRQLVASTRTEWWALALFRLVGYGQRAGPALLTWVIALAVGAAVYAAAAGDVNYETAFWRLASTPLVVLRLVGNTSLPDVAGWREVLAASVQAVIAIPFVFVGIATARYLRADWPFKT